MQLSTSFRRLGANDVRMIGRDGFLIYLFLYINFIALVMRFALPYLDGYLVENGVIGFAFAEWYPMIVAYILIFLGAALVGMIFGFVLLEEKDDDTITALLVSPMPLRNYLAYRVAIPALIAFPSVLILMAITNVALPALWQMVVIAAGASLTAPINALYFAAFAENKVQGLALTKFAGIVGFLIPLAWFTPAPFEFILGLFPPYWISKAYWLALDGSPWWIAAWAAGVVLQSGTIYLLAERFTRVIYRR